VYGTLTGGGSEGALLAHLPRVAARTRGQLWSLPAGYPALVLSPSSSSFVHGELVSPPGDRVLALLDLYEGVADGLYTRVVIDVLVGLRAEAAFAYVMEAARARTGVPLPGGRWRGARASPR
jgi:gamma-glutamylcyclotransferase (GGCT)/AIG2-like uncharacterized protein YtfP